MRQNGLLCDGIQRRNFLSVGSAGLLGGTLILPDILKGQEENEHFKVDNSKDQRSLIVVFLRGGLSTIDTWDLKPNAPSEFRGDFNPISTNVPGIQICEHLPLVSQQMDKFSLIRSFANKNSSHGPADHYMLTGYLPEAGFNAAVTPNNQRPSHGSIIAHKLGGRGAVPPYVCVPDIHPSCGSSYLGARYAPFSVNADPNDPGFTVRDLLPPVDLHPSRNNARRKLLAQVDQFQKSSISQANTKAKTVVTFRKKALELMTSTTAKKAFNIHTESDKIREQYGRNSLGQSCLMARRLVEAGVRCTTIQHVDWDTHDNNFSTLKKTLLPLLDSAMSTLFSDLAYRGLLEKTIVIVTGEFGRTPRINGNAGRDHWGGGFTVAIGGGGIQGGRIVGASTDRAEGPKDSPHGPEDLNATIYHLLGINPKEEFITPEGRPIPIINNGSIIKELM